VTRSPVELLFTCLNDVQQFQSDFILATYQVPNLADTVIIIIADLLPFYQNIHVEY